MSKTNSSYLLLTESYNELHFVDKFTRSWENLNDFSKVIEWASEGARRWIQTFQSALVFSSGVRYVCSSYCSQELEKQKNQWGRKEQKRKKPLFALGRNSPGALNWRRASRFQGHRCVARCGPSREARPALGGWARRAGLTAVPNKTQRPKRCLLS